ncbi:BON domain-containing protein [Azoarcus taiwanensis]|uniref:BON domain-containing protein n=1 Tax=Azoarcus taiwanensis TaxID=666964 RepID=A0A972FDL0_9RHOO|nr:BON domain-containing protein [Azoarcus taiwanensis]NMG02745.1 BON domain-containing protein [Azoarcus taiwanensis]
MIEQETTSLTRRRVLLGAAALATLPALQGCFPVVAGGAVAGAAMISDRRTSGAFMEDEAIEWKTRSALRERFGSGINVSVTSYNRNVLLTGQVPDERTRSEVGRIASGIDNVNGIVNEVEIAGISSLTSRSNDALITSRVKARFVDDQSFRAHQVKVVTEAGTVFLMGIVTRREADAATEVARTTQGVQKVVRVFEFVSDDEAARLDRLTNQ